MPPSAGACQTTDAALKPDCGRASTWSSIIAAIGWRAATSGATGTPVRGAGTSTGVGTGVGGGTVGAGVGGDSLPLGSGAGDPLGSPGELVAAAAPPGPNAPRLQAMRMAAAASATTPAPIRETRAGPPAILEPATRPSS